MSTINGTNLFAAQSKSFHFDNVFDSTNKLSVYENSAKSLVKISDSSPITIGITEDTGTYILYSQVEIINNTIISVKLISSSAADSNGIKAQYGIFSSNNEKFLVYGNVGRISTISLDISSTFNSFSIDKSHPINGNETVSPSMTISLAEDETSKYFINTDTLYSKSNIIDELNLNSLEIQDYQYTNANNDQITVSGKINAKTLKFGNWSFILDSSNNNKITLSYFSDSQS